MNISRPAPATLRLLRLDIRSPLTLQQQLLDNLRSLILQRKLSTGQRLPSSRALAKQLSISRNTVLAVFDQLTSEGYLRGIRGSGTSVAAELPESFLKTRLTSNIKGHSVIPLPESPQPISVRPFRPCVPSITEFPLEIWERIRRRVLTRRGAKLLNYGSPAGDRQLREQIASYLQDFRGVRCEAAQIIVTAGAQQAFCLVARTLGGQVSNIIWFEDPGYIDARLAFEEAGLCVVSRKIDEQGITVPTWEEGAPRLVYMTPSRQFPLGTTMSLARRLEWLEFARNHGVWIIEDDYDSEFRYEGRPLNSLQGLIPNTQVFYIGTFSKSLFPSLRIGYIVVPPSHLAAIWETKETMDVHSPLIDQSVLAEFIEQGHFARHLRKMRSVYAQRAHTFAESTREHWDSIVKVDSISSGLNVAGWLQGGDADMYAKTALAHGNQVLNIARYCRTVQLPPGFLFGFASTSVPQIRKAVQELARIWAPLRK
ncbi:MAG: PLP-dependent aminotransferase family protein [Opitutus sp.]